MGDKKSLLILKDGLQLISTNNEIKLKDITMQRKSFFIKFLFFTTLTFSYLSQAANKISDGEIYAYLELSGVKASIQSMPEQIQMMSQQMQLTSANPEQDKVVIKALLSAWHEEKINEQLITYIQDNMSSAEMTKILSWLNSNQVKKIKSAELQATQTDFQQELMRYMADLQSNPPTPERMKAVKDFVGTTKMTENATDIAIAIVENMFKGMKAAMPNKAMTDEQITQQLTQMRTMMSQVMHQQMMMVSYYLYRDITDAELEEYMSFYKKPIGQTELTVVYAGLKKALSSWGDNIVTELSSALKEKASE